MKKVLYIGNKLSKHGVTATTIETLGPLLESSGFAVSYASSKKRKWLRMLNMLAATIFVGPKSDYILIDTYSTSNFWYAFAVSQTARIFGLKYIPILHGGELPKRLRNNPLLCKMIFGHAFRNVAPSGYLLNAFKEAGFSNTIFIPNSIVLADYPFLERKRLQPKLLWVRSFSKIYNPEMALHVLAALRQQYPRAQLCMVGPEKDGALKKTKLLANQLKLDVEFTGKLPKSEWVRRAADFDIFINTTHFDNTPVSVIEAMALGMPVVSTNVGGIPFLLEHRKTALLVNDNDVSAMVEHIFELLKEEGLTVSLTHNAFQTAQDFDTQKVIQKWIEILS